MNIKRTTKQLATALALAGSLALAAPVQAQYVTGTPYLSNLDPATFNTPPNAVYPNWDAASFNDGANGLEVSMSASTGFGSMYYVIPSADVQYPLNPLDQVAILTLTFNSASGGTPPNWVGVYFGLNDNAGFTGNLGGYGGAGNAGNPANWNWNGNVLTITAPLPTAQLNAIQAAGGDAIYSFNLGIDASPLPAPGAFDVTFNSLVVAVPEPGTFALVGLGLAGLLTIRRRP